MVQGEGRGNFILDWNFFVASQTRNGGLKNWETLKAA